MTFELYDKLAQLRSTEIGLRFEKRPDGWCLVVDLEPGSGHTIGELRDGEAITITNEKDHIVIHRGAI